MAMAGMNFSPDANGGDFPTRCTICNKIFSHKGNLKIHMRIHSDERPFKCPYCQKRFTMKQNMEIHIRIHTGEKPFKCDQCDHRFTTKQQMQKHMQNHMASLNPFVSGKQERCIKCGAFRNEEELRDRVFSNRASLHAHLLTHENIKWYKCNFCDKQFRLKQTKDVHERIHTGCSPFRCMQCGKMFTTKQNMQKHVCTLEM
ncbi:hypothetical protein KUTeg_006494 [Tegillarca granosa]|uniref:C2H2-type domain-containing protein n=1 Tax=Tegillarca granosa TaxID=220873 RepID=A0ABQ9FJM3_TEGGR|nr:hypothetical protein KUTeg_006494 [Tegillarca granosa]